MAEKTITIRPMRTLGSRVYAKRQAALRSALHSRFSHV